MFDSLRLWFHRAARLGVLGAQFISGAAWAGADEISSPPIIHRIDGSADRIELTVNSSRILTMQLKIPRAQVNNPDLLDLTPLSATQLQVHAKKTGVTQVNLWDEKGEIHSIDVIVYGDARELARVLQVNYPNSSIKVFPTANGVILSGFVDRNESVSSIVQTAQQYYPTVLNNIRVGGVQQVLLHVRVVEVSRTKLRDLGFDFANISGGGQDFATSGVSGLLGAMTRGSSGAITGVAAGTGSTMTFGIVDSNNAFFGVLRALQRNSLMKILAEPTLVTVSGRPAYFQAGGEIPVLIPQGLGTVAVEFRRFGTQVDFVPIVLGNGNVRLEVRPRVSELDNSISVTLNGTTIPGFRTREVDTGVELKTGETLALAGLIQNRVEVQKSGVPWLGDLPYIGVPFRRINETNNEVELLIMVRPEVAEAMAPEEVPCGGPGLDTTSPSNWDLYMRGYVEVPKGHPDLMKHGGAFPPASGSFPAMQGGPPQQQMQMMPRETVPTPDPNHGTSTTRRMPAQTPPPQMAAQPAPTTVRPAPMNEPVPTYQVQTQPAQTVSVRTAQAPRPAGPQEPMPALPPVSPVTGVRRDPATPMAGGNARNNPTNPSQAPTSRTSSAAKRDSSGPGLIGPVGYDLSK